MEYIKHTGCDDDGTICVDGRESSSTSPEGMKLKKFIEGSAASSSSSSLSSSLSSSSSSSDELMRRFEDVAAFTGREGPVDGGGPTAPGALPLPLVTRFFDGILSKCGETQGRMWGIGATNELWDVCSTPLDTWKSDIP